MALAVLLVLALLTGEQIEIPEIETRFDRYVPVSIL